MPTRRREFLKTAATTGGALALGLGSASPGSALVSKPALSNLRKSTQAPRALKILILGGTNLTGPHNVRYALERGHDVTIFTRGQKKPGLFQDAFEHVEHLIGDREDNLEALKGPNG